MDSWGRSKPMLVEGLKGFGRFWWRAATRGRSRSSSVAVDATRGRTTWTVARPVKSATSWTSPVTVTSTGSPGGSAATTEARSNRKERSGVPFPSKSPIRIWVEGTVPWKRTDERTTRVGSSAAGSSTKACTCFPPPRVWSVEGEIFIAVAVTAASTRSSIGTSTTGLTGSLE